MAGNDKSKEELESSPLTKGEKAHALTIAKNPDMQPELKTLPLKLGKGAENANKEEVPGKNPVVEKEAEAKKAPKDGAKAVSAAPAIPAASAPAEKK
jgi:hypothetical protein